MTLRVADPKEVDMATLKEQVKDLTQRLEKLEKRMGMAPLKGVLADFKKMMENFDRRTLEQIFQGESDRGLAIALMGQAKPVLENAKGAMSKARWKQVRAEMENLMVEGVSKRWVKSSQEDLQRKIQRLEDMGEIVVGGMGGPMVGHRWPFPEPPKLDLRDWKEDVLDSLAG